LTNVVDSTAQTTVDRTQRTSHSIASIDSDDFNIRNQLAIESTGVAGERPNPNGQQ
jgi:hypothetical protein